MGAWVGGRGEGVQDYDGRNISRKLANEAEIVEMLKHGFNVGVQSDIHV